MTNAHEGLHLAFSDDDEEAFNIKKRNELAVPIIKPGVRFFARFIDNYLFSILLVSILLYYTPDFDFNDLIFGILSLFAWIFVESFLLITWGTTPGKWLLNTKIKTIDNKKLSLGQAFKRSFRVWFFGLGLGIPFVTLFTLFCAYLELNKNQETTWDKSGHLTVSHQAIPSIKILIAVFIIATPFAINLYELYTSMPKHQQVNIKYQGLSANYY